MVIELTPFLSLLSRTDVRHRLSSQPRSVRVVEKVDLPPSPSSSNTIAILSRQFREMPKARIEALLASFPKLTSQGTQHTTVETDNLRYVYQPLEELYMVLITSKRSYILQDIDSLHLFAQVVTSVCRNGLDEREILRNAFELLSAFDEIVCLGFRENLTLPQVKNILEMESQEEKIQDIIARVPTNSFEVLANR